MSNCSLLQYKYSADWEEQRGATEEGGGGGDCPPPPPPSVPSLLSSAAEDPSSTVATAVMSLFSFEPTVASSNRHSPTAVPSHQHALTRTNTAKGEHKGRERGGQE